MTEDDSRPLLIPRGLILFGSVWLILSWMLSLGLRTPLQPSSASYTPGVGIMLLCVVVGLMIGWPLLRLSESRQVHPVGQTLLDLLVLLALVQVVIWPLRLVTPWPPVRTAAIDATMASWMVLVAAILASTTGAARGGPRVLAMIACLGLCLFGPIAASIGARFGHDVSGLIYLNPLTAVHELTGGGASAPSASEWRWILVMVAAATSSWLALFGWMIARSIVRRPDADPPVSA